MSAVNLGVVAPQPSSGSCAGPGLVPPAAGQAETIPALVLEPGQYATVEGRLFFDGCADSYSTGGCGRGRYDDPQSLMRAVALTLHQGPHRWALATADAAEQEIMIAG